MKTLSNAQRSRSAIRVFKTTADALAQRGYYKPSGRSGQTLADSLKTLSPEIYGTMNDPRIIELKGLEYVMDRLPRGIEECSRIILTAQEDLGHTSFDHIIPLKRRRTSYRVSDHEMSFVITRGMSEIYDILTHLTFLTIEAVKIHETMTTSEGKPTREWETLKDDAGKKELSGPDLDRALWNLSIVLGRTFQETRETYLELEENRKKHHSNNGLFRIICSLGKRVEHEINGDGDSLMVYFTPSLRDMIGSHRYGRIWADTIKSRLVELGLEKRPIHIVSANMHSIMNTLFAYAARREQDSEKDFYEFIQHSKKDYDRVKEFAREHGLVDIPDESGAFIDCQIIDTRLLDDLSVHPAVTFSFDENREEAPVLVVMDYAFGAQAFEVLEELLSPLHGEEDIYFNISSVSIMGKAGILPGNKGDIMLATAHVFEGTPHNYIVKNDLEREDFPDDVNVYCGPIVTVLGTSLQNRDVLEKFQKTSWKAVGLEMEGGHYHRAINAAIIRKHISPSVKVRYAYYASDNPLQSGQTLSSGALGDEGIKPTYMITRSILQKILK